MKALFFISLALYAAAVILQFTGTAFKKDKLLRLAWWVFLGAFAVHAVFIAVRGVVARRIPLSNQFEFANAFAWGVALMLIVVRGRMKADWLTVAAMPAALLVAAFTLMILGLYITFFHEPVLVKVDKAGLAVGGPKPERMRLELEDLLAEDIQVDEDKEE